MILCSVSVRVPALVSLCTHLDSHICQLQPLPPLLLPRFDRSVLPAACFKFLRPPQYLALHAKQPNSYCCPQTGGGRGDREGSSMRMGEKDKSKCPRFLSPCLNQDLFNLTFLFLFLFPFHILLTLPFFLLSYFPLTHS